MPIYAHVLEHKNMAAALLPFSKTHRIFPLANLIWDREEHFWANVSEGDKTKWPHMEKTVQKEQRYLGSIMQMTTCNNIEEPIQCL